jgi:general L-amino acid transport system substrate-binding protein
LVSGERELSGALLSPDLGNAHSTVGPDPVANGYMNQILQRGHMICGIARQRAGFAQQDPLTGEWRGMDVDFCRAVSASLFHGNPDRHLKLVDFDNNSTYTLHQTAFEALANGRVDILSGMSMSLSRDVSEPSSGEGCSFSLPYYYDNEQ